MNIFITYGDNNYLKQKKIAVWMARVLGGFDKVITYGPEDIEDSFRDANSEIMNNKYGGGYWLWKPYLIMKTLQKMSDGDCLFYSDACSYFIRNVNPLIKLLDVHNQDVIGFELPLLEMQWTSPSVFELMNVEKSFGDKNQLSASFYLIRKSDFSVKFFSDLLVYSRNPRCIIGPVKACETRNEFIEHRYDQSVFSLLYRKYNLIGCKDPTQYNKYPEGYIRPKHEEEVRRYKLNTYIESYGMLIFHYRSQSPFISFLKFMVKIVLKKRNVT
ncbi:MAG: hypothetical protein MJK11_14610 [Pseudomonadales bacterium]|nr:hypothetical protein [Pseudomonadales bacterium]